MHAPETTPPVEPETAIAHIIAFFEGLTPHGLATIAHIYAPQAHFKDPFNEVQGTEPIQRIFAHMFDTLHQPRFVVTGQVLQGHQCFLTWDFLFHFKSFDKATLQTVRGASHLVLDTQGRITLHRDYWDAAEELYEKIPVLGGLMRYIKKRANS